MSYIKFKLDKTTYKSEFESPEEHGEIDAETIGREIGSALCALTNDIIGSTLEALAQAIQTIIDMDLDATPAHNTTEYEKAINKMCDAASDALIAIRRERTPQTKSPPQAKDDQ